MHSFFIVVPFLAVGAVASLGPTSDNWRDYEWSTWPDKTANELAAEGKALPALAIPITQVREHESYVAKLECVGCPFRVRERGQVYEPWQEPAQDNSLLLNFTVAEDKHSLLVNGQKIFPLSLPAPVYAFQTPANLSADIMEKIVSMQMLDSSFNVGTKYGRFELSFEHTTTMEDRTTRLLRFDVTSVDIQYGSNPGGSSLTDANQKAVQLRLSQESWEEGMKIQDIEIIDRATVMIPGLMPCGKPAPVIRTPFRVVEWDYYGHKGTWSHTFAQGWDWFLDNLMHNLFILVVLSLLGGTVRYKKMQQRKEAARRLEEPDVVVVVIEEEEGLLEKEFSEKEDTTDLPVDI